MLPDGTPYGKEFCSILNEALREDDANVMKEAAGLACGLNELCVMRGVGAQVVWPKDFVLYRGAGLPDLHQGGQMEDSHFIANILFIFVQFS